MNSRVICQVVIWVLLGSCTVSAGEEARPEDLRAAKTLGGVVVRQDFGAFKFAKATMQIMRQDNRMPGRGALMFVNYTDEKDDRAIMVTIQWFPNQKDLLAQYDAVVKRQGGKYRMREVDGATIWAVGDSIHSWTDGSNFLVNMGGMDTPPAMVRAHLAVIPSGIAKTGNVSPAKRKSPAKLPGSLALVKSVTGRDFGKCTFQQCMAQVRRDPSARQNTRRVSSENQRFEGTGLAGVIYAGNGEQKATNEILRGDRGIYVSVQWFDDKKRLEAEYARLLGVHKETEKKTFGTSNVLRSSYGGREYYIWCDGRNRIAMVAVKGVPPIPAEMIKAYLARVPSREMPAAKG